MRSTLPLQFSGTCAPVTLILPVTVYENFPDTSTPLLPPNRPKRSVVDDIAETDPTYIDAIGVPRGVPTEYKLVDQVAAGFESIICWWCTINKNVDRINYVHYNVQRLANYTRDGFMAVHEQLSATSLMAFQNRIAVDMLLAERGGVCSLFGDQCCTFIPNNTAADGKLSRAVNGLRSLSNRLKRQSGVDTSLWDSWLDIFGKYKSIIASLFLSILVSVVLIVLCGCCCIPCARSLLSRMVNVALGDKLVSLLCRWRLDPSPLSMHASWVMVMTGPSSLFLAVMTSRSFLPRTVMTIPGCFRLTSLSTEGKLRLPSWEKHLVPIVMSGPKVSFFASMISSIPLTPTTPTTQ